MSMAALVIVVWSGAWLAYRTQWSSLDQFAAAIDHCPILFCDFDRYFYRQGQVILDAKQPIAAYLYSAPFAVALSIFDGMPLDRARLVWGAAQIVVTLGVFATPLFFARQRGQRPWVDLVIYAVAFASCTAVLHNFKWGQVSALMALGILLSLVLADRSRPVAAGLVLAIPIAIKYYAAPALLFFIFRRDWRALLACAAGVAAAAALSMAVLGPSETIAFQRTVNEHALAASRDAWVRADPNSQFFAHVMARWTGAASRGWALLGYLRLRSERRVALDDLPQAPGRCRALGGDADSGIHAVLGGYVVAALLHLFARVAAHAAGCLEGPCRSRLDPARDCELRVRFDRHRIQRRASLDCRCAWQPYSANGYLFVANAVVLAGAYLVIAREFSAPPATAAAARTP